MDQSRDWLAIVVAKISKPPKSLWVQLVEAGTLYKNKKGNH